VKGLGICQPKGRAHAETALTEPPKGDSVSDGFTYSERRAG
jgi:hypothetical protein